jgi:predicted PurR-regulated permease PerM
MTLQRQVIFWIAAFAVLIAFLFVFSDILLPFVAGMVIAYALDPLADRLERLGIGRASATLIILVLVLVSVVLAVLLLLPILATQLAQLIDAIPSYIEKLEALLSSFVHSNFLQYLGIDLTDVGSSLGQLTGQGARWTATLAATVWTGGLAVLNILGLLVVTPVVAFYLLYDWDRLVGKVDSLLPRDDVGEVRQIARDIDRVIAAFIRGQGLVCLIMAAFYASGLLLIGLNFGFLIGLLAGLLGFIPFVGATVGFVLSVGVAIVQFWPDWIWIAATVLIFAMGQFIEGYILQPRLIGKNVGLHPVWVIFALFAFGYLFGFVGVMVAVPAAAAVGVLVRYAIRRYQESPIYRGDGRSAKL